MCCQTKRWRGANSCPVESVSILKAAKSSSWLDHTVHIWSHRKEEEMHRPPYIPLSITTPTPPRTSSFLWRKSNQAENSLPASQPAGVKLVLLSAPITPTPPPPHPLLDLQRRDGHFISLLHRRRLKLLFGSWSPLSSVLHVGPESARLESLMQPVVLAGRPSQGSRGAELRVGEA